MFPDDEIAGVASLEGIVPEVPFDLIGDIPPPPLPPAAPTSAPSTVPGLGMSPEDVAEMLRNIAGGVRGQPDADTL